MTTTAGIRAPQTTAIVQLQNAAYCDLGKSLPISFLGASPYTFEGWFSFHGLCPDSMLLAKPGEFSFGTKGSSVYVTRAGQLFPLQTAAVLDIDKWIHLAVTFDGSTLALYVDGLLTVSTSTPGPGIGNQGQNFALGSTFQGQIDSFRVWSVARTEDELYQGQWATLGPTPGLVSDYDCTQSPPKDISGNSNPITLRNGAQSLLLTPAVQMSNASYCEPVDDGPLVNPGGGGNDPYTILAWVNLDYVGDGPQCIFANGDYSSATGIYLMVDASGVIDAIRGPGNPPLRSNAVLQAGQWYCIGWTYDGTTQSLYVNGALDSSAASAAIGTMPMGDLTLGAAFNSSANSAMDTVQGCIQFLSVWNICLSATDINNWMYHDPTDQTGVTANYSFAGGSAINLQTDNPVGLAAGATLVELRSPGAAIPVVREPVAAEPRLALTADDLEQRSAFYTPEVIATMVEEYRRALPPHMPRDERFAAVARFEAKLRAIANGDPTVSPYRQVRHRIVQDGDAWSLRRLTDQGEVEIARRSAAELTACQAAEISFLIAALDLFLGLLGLAGVEGAAERFFQIRIGNPGFATALQAIFSVPLAPLSILRVIAILWDFGWFTSLAQVILQGMTWWDWLTLAARVVAMIVPYPTFQKAYAIAQVAIGIWEVAAAFAAVNSACGPGNVPGTPTPVTNSPLSA